MPLDNLENKLNQSLYILDNYLRAGEWHRHTHTQFLKGVQYSERETLIFSRVRLPAKVQTGLADKVIQSSIHVRI